MFLGGTLEIKEEVFELGYIPPYLVVRKEKLNELFRIVLPILRKRIRTVVIKGEAGVGKTLIAKMALRRLRNRAEKEGIPFLVVYLKRIDSSYSALVQILEKLSEAMVKAGLNRIPASIPRRGFAFEELFSLFKSTLKMRGIRLGVILDNLVPFPIREKKLLEELVKEEESENQPGIAIICITSPEAEGELVEILKLPFVIEMPAYKEEEIKKILLQRIELGIIKGRVEEEAISTIAQLAVERGGNATFAIRLLRNALMEAQWKNQNVLKEKHVKKALEKLPRTLTQKTKETITGLLFHEKLILLAIAKALKRKDSETVTIGEVEKTYIEICKKLKVSPRKHTTVWEAVKKMEHLNIIHTRLSGKGFKGRTTLISLTHYIPSLEALSRFLEKTLI